MNQREYLIKGPHDWSRTIQGISPNAAALEAAAGAFADWAGEDTGSAYPMTFMVEWAADDGHSEAKQVVVDIEARPDFFVLSTS
ncbi:MAG: hypothetical protein ACYTG0_12530 [Planctomycetota bacterium]|jgi:hypothetical protein